MDITKLTGEELCELQAQQFNLLMQSQNNLQMIAKELERRKAPKVEPKVEPKAE